MILSGQAPERLKVSVTEVQVDAVVTNREGRAVTDLSKDDFEIFENGQRRELTYVTFVDGRGANAALPVRRTEPAVLPGALRRESISRTVAIVVDDLRMSFQGVNNTRETLRRFVREQIRPGDLVAILSTSGSLGPLQSFTTDPHMLNAAIDRLRLYLRGGGQAGQVQALGPGGETDDVEISRIKHRLFAVGTLGGLKHVIAGMQDLPGRKSVVLFSEGQALVQRPRKENPVTLDELHQVSSAANMSAVVIYCIDVRGLVYPGLQAQDDTATADATQVQEALANRAEKIRDEQDGLRLLARATGGIAQINDNDLNGALRRVLEDQSGYYILGFRPDEDSAERIARQGKFRTVSVRVKPSGLRVRYRGGYMGGSDSLEPERRTTAQRLMAALVSPFTDGGIRLRLTPMVAFGPDGSPVLQALIHINGSDLSFEQTDSDGRQTARIDIVGATEGRIGHRDSSTERTFTIRAEPSGLEQIRSKGFVYRLQYQRPAPGAYQFRIAVLDEATGKIGSASRFIEIPDVRRGATAMSGIAMCEGDQRTRLTAGSTDAQEEDASMALRVFKRSQPFSYGLTVYNARTDSRTGEPGFELQPRLLRDGQVVWRGGPMSLAAGPNSRQLLTGGVMRLGDSTQPGEYIFEVQMVDKKSRATVGTQWTDFELR